MTMKTHLSRWWRPVVMLCAVVGLILLACLAPW